LPQHDEQTVYDPGRVPVTPILALGLPIDLALALSGAYWQTRERERLARKRCGKLAGRPKNQE